MKKESPGIPFYIYSDRNLKSFECLHPFPMLLNPFVRHYQKLLSLFRGIIFDRCKPVFMIEEFIQLNGRRFAINGEALSFLFYRIIAEQRPVTSVHSQFL